MPFDTQGRAVIGVLVGMKTEAACLAPLGPAVRIACSGARVDLARARTLALVAGGAQALISFGIAGALQPGLLPGAVVLPRAVIVPGVGEVAVSALWHRRLAGRAEAGGLSVLSTVTVAGSDHAVDGASGKAELARVSGAVAVDMESHVVAEVAARHGLPFIVLRAIADPAERGIPGPALAGLGPDGETRPGAVMMRLLAEPSALPALLRLAQDSKAGLAALRRAVSVIGREGLLAP